MSAMPMIFVIATQFKYREEQQTGNLMISLMKEISQKYMNLPN